MTIKFEWKMKVGSSSLDTVRYSVEAEKYRAAAGYMAGHNLYGADPVAAAAAASKYLEASSAGKSGDGELNNSTSGGKSSYTESSGASNDGSANSSAASKAYLETAKLYMDSKNYAAEVQRAYMLDAAAKSIYNDSGKNESSGGTEMADIKNERSDGPSPPGFHPATLASYYSQAAAAAAVAGQPGNPATGLSHHHQSPSGLSGLVPGLYSSPAGTYPSSGEYRRPLPVIFWTIYKKLCNKTRRKF